MKYKIIPVVIVVALVVAGVGFLAIGSRSADGNDMVSNEAYLNIFGNANGDAVLDETDIALVEEIIAGNIPKDDQFVVEDALGKKRLLADADCNGVIDSRDIDMIRGIIDGSVERFNILDGHFNFINVPMNPEKIVCEFYSNAEMLNLMGVQDRIVVADAACHFLKDYYLMNAEHEQVKNMGAMNSPNYEIAQAEDPDIWLTYGNSVNRVDHTAATVVGLNLTNVNLVNIHKSGVVQGTLLAGYIFNNTEAADEYVGWIIELWETLNEVSANLDDSERPDVFYTGYGNYITDSDSKLMRCFLPGTNLHQAVKLAGGRNIIDDFERDLPPGSGTPIGIEWLMDQNYDYMFIHSIKFTGGGTASPHVPMHGYITDDPTEWNDAKDRIAGLPLFTDLDPNNIVLSAGDFMNNASGGLLNAVLVATTIHPDLFPDLNMQNIQQEYVDIMGFDFDLSEHGVF